MFQQDKEIQECSNNYAESIIDNGNARDTNIGNLQYKLYAYDGKMWHVPQNFTFPSNAKLLTGWQLWIRGQPGYKINKEREGDEEVEAQLAPVRPFCLLSRKFLPKEARQVYSLSWEPIYNLMQSAPNMDITLDPQESFKIGYKYLKSRVEYIFNSPKMKPDTWRVAYWSVKVQRSSIIKFGTEGKSDH